MNIEHLQASARSVSAALGSFRPQAAAILGSGWGNAIERLAIVREIPYPSIPALGATAIAGHAGRLLAASANGFDVLVFQGRRHWYEGKGWTPVAFPVFLTLELGAKVLLLTNAAGGIRSDLQAGEVMVIDDHINAMGVHPLVGPHHPHWGSRFPDMTRVYDPGLSGLLDEAGKAANRTLAHGVYLATSGPTYETPAEISAFRAMGADAVGMSTVPEAILAHAAGLRVAALSCITNPAAGLGGRPLNHKDVIEQTQRQQDVLASLVTAFFHGLQAQG